MCEHYMIKSLEKHAGAFNLRMRDHPIRIVVTDRRRHEKAFRQFGVDHYFITDAEFGYKVPFILGIGGLLDCSTTRALRPKGNIYAAFYAAGVAPLKSNG